MGSLEQLGQQPEGLPSGPNSLQVDFSWKKLKALVTEDNGNGPKPVYIADCKSMKIHPELHFQHAENEEEFAVGTIHPISIDADAIFRGQPIKIKATKRWRTKYEHLSYAYSSTPTVLSWVSDSDFKTWDFICLDPNQLPIAKFSAKIWALKKFGNIEFLGEATENKEMREEIVVVGLTLFSCMSLRATSLLSFFGAFFAKPGHIDADKTAASPATAVEGEERSADAAEPPDGKKKPLLVID